MAGKELNQRKYMMRITKSKRLRRIAEIIEDVDNRCMAADGPVTPTLQEMTQKEMSEIYGLAKGDETILRRQSRSR